MINTHLKFEAKIPNRSKVFALMHSQGIIQNYKIFQVKSQFDLEGQGHQFSKMSEIFR